MRKVTSAIIIGLILLITIVYWLNNPNKSKSNLSKILTERYLSNKARFDQMGMTAFSMVNSDSCLKFTWTYTAKGLFWQECDSFSNENDRNFKLSENDSVMFRNFMKDSYIERIICNKRFCRFIFEDLAFEDIHSEIVIVNDTSVDVTSYLKIGKNVYYKM